MVSIGIFVLLEFVNVLLVIDSPIDGAPCDELDWCWLREMFSVHRTLFEVHKRFMIAETWKSELGKWTYQCPADNDYGNDSQIIYVFVSGEIASRISTASCGW